MSNQKVLSSLGNLFEFVDQAEVFKLDDKIALKAKLASLI